MRNSPWALVKLPTLSTISAVRIQLRGDDVNETRPAFILDQHVAPDAPRSRLPPAGRTKQRSSDPIVGGQYPALQEAVRHHRIGAPYGGHGNLAPELAGPEHPGMMEAEAVTKLVDEKIPDLFLGARHQVGRQENVAPPDAPAIGSAPREYEGSAPAGVLVVDVDVAGFTSPRRRRAADVPPDVSGGNP